ncbi:MAG: hypothetical protein ACR2NS_12820 [Gemmatimonadaceae bacterium]
MKSYHLQARLRPLDEITLAAGNQFQLEAAGAASAKIRLDAPPWMPPGKDTEATMTIISPLQPPPVFVSGQHVSLSENGTTVAEGIILKARTKTITEHQ